MQNNTSLIYVIALAGLVAACDEQKQPSSGAPEGAPDTKAPAAETELPGKAEAPGCDAVVDRIASFNPGSGDPERKLWGKMCDEMTPAQRSCVVAANDMDGMKACVADQKLKDDR